MIQRPAQVHLQTNCQITVCLRHRIQGGHKHHHTTGHGSNAAAIRRHLITERLAQAGEPQIIEQGFLLAGIVVEAGRIGHQIIRAGFNGDSGCRLVELGDHRFRDHPVIADNRTGGAVFNGNQHIRGGGVTIPVAAGIAECQLLHHLVIQVASRVQGPGTILIDREGSLVGIDHRRAIQGDRVIHSVQGNDVQRKGRFQPGIVIEQIATGGGILDHLGGVVFGEGAGVIHDQLDVGSNGFRGPVRIILGGIDRHLEQGLVQRRALIHRQQQGGIHAIAGRVQGQRHHRLPVAVADHTQGLTVRGHHHRDRTAFRGHCRQAVLGRREGNLIRLLNADIPGILIDPSCFQLGFRQDHRLRLNQRGRGIRSGVARQIRHLGIESPLGLQAQAGGIHRHRPGTAGHGAGEGIGGGAVRQGHGHDLAIFRIRGASQLIHCPQQERGQRQTIGAGINVDKDAQVDIRLGGCRGRVTGLVFGVHLRRQATVHKAGQVHRPGTPGATTDGGIRHRDLVAGTVGEHNADSLPVFHAGDGALQLHLADAGGVVNDFPVRPQGGVRIIQKFHGHLGQGVLVHGVRRRGRVTGAIVTVEGDGEGAIIQAGQVQIGQRPGTVAGHRGIERQGRRSIIEGDFKGPALLNLCGGAGQGNAGGFGRVDHHARGHLYGIVDTGKRVVNDIVGGRHRVAGLVRHRGGDRQRPLFQARQVQIIQRPGSASDHG